MKKLCRRLACVAVGAVFVLPASAADRVRLTNGQQTLGNLVDMSATKVTIQLGSTRRELAVNEIESVQYDDEPKLLSPARAAVRDGRYADALAGLAKIPPAEVKRPEVAKDVQFYQALAAARLALAGNGSIAEAGKKMFAFEQANRDNYHYFQACETLGDLLAALGRFSDAEVYYGKLAEAPWPEFKMRAGVLVGRALVRQKKHDEAVRKFDEVLASGASGDDVPSQQAAASLGKASALAGAGQTDEAVKLVDEVIAAADPENKELYARAYNVLGNCHNAAGKNTEALLAFLHVDLLYPGFAEQHAEALANLAVLWDKVNKSERAAQARETLKEKYPHSVWAAK